MIESSQSSETFLTDVSVPDLQGSEIEKQARDEDSSQSGTSMTYIERVTAVLGLVFLVSGLAIWMGKPHSQHRLALLVLVCAMLFSILHYYTVQDGSEGDGR